MKTKDTFYMIVYGSDYKKGDILHFGYREVKILKTYPFNWWRKILKRLGFKITNSNTVKVRGI